jgi:hypothetical protein
MNTNLAALALASMHNALALAGSIGESLDVDAIVEMELAHGDWGDSDPDDVEAALRNAAADIYTDREMITSRQDAFRAFDSWDNTGVTTAAEMVAFALGEGGITPAAKGEDGDLKDLEKWADRWAEARDEELDAE